MLSIFRRGIVAKLMLVVLGIGLFAIVITGFGTDGMGLGALGSGKGGNIAKVDGETITAAEVRQQVDRQFSRARLQQPELDLTTFLSTGALEDVVRQLIDQAAMMLFAKDIGLAASEQAITEQIARIPAFQNMAGTFDRPTFLAALQREKMTEAQLREEIEAMLIQRQLIVPVAGSARVPRAIAAEYASLLLESRSGSVGIVPAAAMGMGREPSDAEIAAHYNQNKTRYIVPERRVLRHATFGAEQVAAAAKPSEAEIAALYKANAATYAPSTTRTLTQVIAPTEAAARAIAQKIAAGTSISAAASQAGLGASTLQRQSKQDFQNKSSAAVANAAFAAAKGAIAGPARSGLGWHIVRVDEIVTTPGRPLAAVRGELEARLTAQKSLEALSAMGTRIEDAIADGSSFEDIVKAEKLTVAETPAITATGTAPGNAAWRPSPELGPLLSTGFEMAPDEDPVVETIAEGTRYALLAVGRVEAAAAPPLASIRERVKGDLVTKRALDRARAVATAILAKINAGVAPAKAFAEAGMTLPAVQPITTRRMDIARQNQQVPPPLSMLFSLPRGKARLLAAPNGSGWFVVHLDKVVPGDARSTEQLVETTRAQFSQVLGDEYAQQFNRAGQAGMKIQRNEEAVAALKREMTGAGGTQ
jgi:peptidyl-prolyl cis-trans isomerase D